MTSQLVAPTQPDRAVQGRSNFQSIFFPDDHAVCIRVPDYQRAYSWEHKQIEMFIADLVKYERVGKGYYFGHFIAEDLGTHWEIVDGQQRITTFVLFLMVCRLLSPSGDHATAVSLIDRFATVSYDRDALKSISSNLGVFLEKSGQFDERKLPPDEQIILGLSLQEATFTRSQRRAVLALLHFHRAFKKGVLDREKIRGYIAAVMTAHCSRHLTEDKSVAVNIFEMHNTRGLPLTTLEIIKAMLMKFVYDHDSAKVEEIQKEFGEIYRMEERVAECSFRGEMTMEQLLRLHLRVVDDGTKKTAAEFDSPATNANGGALIQYVDSRLHFVDGAETIVKTPVASVQYALDFAREFRRSVQIVSETLPTWDAVDSLVGDVVIQDRELSYQFFLLICRRLEKEANETAQRLSEAVPPLWEKLLFTRDFHDRYYGKHYGDNFPKLFASCAADEDVIDVLKVSLADGFRPWKDTKGLQSIVAAFLKEQREKILNGAFYWWKPKMIYAIYKYEKSRGADIREVMKGTISVEHILPQEWQWEWIDGWQVASERSPEEKEAVIKNIQTFINGLGNLLLLTPGENTAVGNRHPADKLYRRFSAGGSYKDHDQNRERWRSSEEWSGLIRERGEEIFNFMLSTLVDVQEESPVSTPN
jgi:hypothetical protein